MDSYFSKIISYFQENWDAVDAYHQQHFAIRVLRVQDNDFFKEYIQQSLTQKQTELARLTEIFQNSTQSQAYTNDLLTTRFSHSTQARKEFYLAHPQYLVANYYLWTLYELNQLGISPVTHINQNIVSYIINLDEALLLKTIASKFLNNIFALEVYGYDIIEKKRVVNKYISKVFQADRDQIDLVNLFYLITHWYINESHFYQQFITSDYIQAITRLVKILHDKSLEVCGVKYLDMYAELILSRYLLKLDVSSQIEEFTGSLREIDETELIDIRYEHTLSLILLVYWIHKVRTERYKPFKSIKIIS
jgi:hypothetical protein